MNRMAYRVLSIISFISSVVAAVTWFVFFFYFIFGTLKIGFASGYMASLRLIYEGVAFLNVAFTFLVPLAFSLLFLDIAFIVIIRQTRDSKYMDTLIVLFSLIGTILIFIGWYGYILGVNNYLETIKNIFSRNQDPIALKYQIRIVTSEFYSRSVDLVRIGLFIKSITYILFTFIVCDIAECSKGLTTIFIGLGILLSMFAIIIMIILPTIGFFWLGIILYRHFNVLIRVEKIKETLKSTEK